MQKRLVISVLLLGIFSCVSVHTKLGNIRPNVDYFSIHLNSNSVLELSNVLVEIRKKNVDSLSIDTIDYLLGYDFRKINDETYSITFTTPIYSNSIVKIQIKDSVYIYDKFQIEKCVGTPSIKGSSYEFFSIIKCQLNGINYDSLKNSPFQIKFFDKNKTIKIMNNNIRVY